MQLLPALADKERKELQWTQVHARIDRLTCWPDCFADLSLKDIICETTQSVHGALPYLFIWREDVGNFARVEQGVNVL